MAVAEDLACDLASRCGRDFDQLCFGWWQIVASRQKIAGEGLQMAIAEKAPWLKVRGENG
jgi:hypothetical protein